MNERDIEEYLDTCVRMWISMCLTHENLVINNNINKVSNNVMKYVVIFSWEINEERTKTKLTSDQTQKTQTWLGGEGGGGYLPETSGTTSSCKFISTIYSLFSFE